MEICFAHPFIGPTMKNEEEKTLWLFANHLWYEHKLHQSIPIHTLYCAYRCDIGFEYASSTSTICDNRMEKNEHTIYSRIDSINAHFIFIKPVDWVWKHIYASWYLMTRVSNKNSNGGSLFSIQLGILTLRCWSVQIGDRTERIAHVHYVFAENEENAGNAPVNSSHDKLSNVSLFMILCF